MPKRRQVLNKAFLARKKARRIAREMQPIGDTALIRAFEGKTLACDTNVCFFNKEGKVFSVELPAGETLTHHYLDFITKNAGQFAAPIGRVATTAKKLPAKPR